MQKLTLLIFVILFSSCAQQEKKSLFTGYWEGPHPDDLNKKFYIRIFSSNDSLISNGYWTENKFYQSEFQVDSLIMAGNEIRFYVPMWNCFYSGDLIDEENISGGFLCAGEPFDTVNLMKNNQAEDFLLNPKPGCNMPGYQYKYILPDLLDDGIDISGFQTKNDSIFIYSVVPEIIQGKYGRINSFLVLKNNQLICEEYFYGYSKSDIHPIESCTKSISSLLVGIAFDQGMINNISEPLYKIFPEYSHLKSGEYKNITIRHLLTMTSGFEPGDDKLIQSENRIEFALNRNLVQKPGTKFQYDGGNTEILGAILKQKTGMFADDFAKKYLFEFLKTKSFVWEARKQNGYPLMSGSLCLTPRDMAKIGMLVLNSGYFNSRQIISEKWILESTSVKTKTHIPGDNYSFHWWNPEPVSNGKKYRAIWANGWGSQFIYIIPEINVVIVTTGYNYESDSWAIINGINKYLHLLDLE